MRHHFASRLLVVVAIAGFLSAAPEAQGPQQLFQQALAKERAEGALLEAVALYQRVVREAGTDRALAARALVQLGGVYEKLQRPEAESTYDQVIREFADQVEMVSVARQRFAALAQPAGLGQPPARDTSNVFSLKDPQLRPAPMALSGIISPDGQWLLIGGGPGPDRRPRPLQPYRSLYVRNVKTDEMRTIDTAAAGVERMQAFVWAPDSKRVAYNKCYAAAPPQQPTQVCELLEATLQGGSPRAIVARSSSFISPLAWSPDGHSIAVSTYGRFGPDTESVAIVSAVEGSIREVTRLVEGQSKLTLLPGGMAFSPDGRFLTMSKAVSNGPRDIYLVAIDGSGERPLIQHPSDDRFVAWTPAGNLVFRSDRGGTIDLWLAHVLNGRVEEMPTIVKRDLGSFASHGMTEQGALYLLTPGPQELPQGDDAISFEDTFDDVVVASLDRATGDLVSTPSPVAPGHAGRTHSASWSGDGRSLIYRTRDIGTMIWTSYTILSTSNGEAREVRPAGIHNLAQQNAWMTPDGRSLIVVGLMPLPNGSREERLFRVDAQTGATSGPIGTAFRSDVELLPDGKAVAISLTSPNGPAQVVLRSLETGEDRVVFQATGKATLGGRAVSSDGKFLTVREILDGKARMLVVSLTDGHARELLTLPTGMPASQKTRWSADGRFIYYVGRTPPSTNEELWRVSVDGGAPKKLLTYEGEIWNVGTDPTGRYLSFTAQHHGDLRELVIEGFLPASELLPATKTIR